jgi:peroxiredoxin (alkyl hydroperoxide reductase subunit C)
LAFSESADPKIFHPQKAKPIDSETALKVGDVAPEIELPSLMGEKISLSSFRGKKRVVISFIPAAWTPVCSNQWPGYNLARDVFLEHDTVVLGVSVDNLPTLFAWTREMGDLWFPVLSDFWPHGQAAKAFGALRTDGMSERALFVVDKKGIIRYIDVHDINEMPRLETLVRELEKLKD